MYSTQYIENHVRNGRRNKDDFIISYGEKNNNMYFCVFCLDIDALYCNFVICEIMYALFFIWVCFVSRVGFNTTLFDSTLDDLQWRCQDDGHAFDNWWLHFSVS